jgi:predicted PurR-regulated permease PerM
MYYIKWYFLSLIGALFFVFFMLAIRKKFVRYMNSRTDLDRYDTSRYKELYNDVTKNYSQIKKSFLKRTVCIITILYWVMLWLIYMAVNSPCGSCK